MNAEEETLITKVQIEFTKGTSIEIVEGMTPWDIGLVYLTTKNLWFVNRKAEKTQIPFKDILTVGNIVPRKEKTFTKYTEVLTATDTMKMDFEEVTKHIATTVLLSCPGAVLKAFRHQLAARLDESKSKIESVDTYSSMDSKAANAPPMSRKLLLRNLAALLHLRIKDDNQLLFFLGIQEKDLVNLLIEHSSIMN